MERAFKTLPKGNTPDPGIMFDREGNGQDFL